MLQLLLEEESALGGFRDGKVLGRNSKLVDVAVGEFSGAARIAILDRYMDQTINVVSGHGRLALECLACIRVNPRVVLLH